MEEDKDKVGIYFKEIISGAKGDMWTSASFRCSCWEMGWGAVLGVGKSDGEAVMELEEVGMRQ